MRGETLGHCQRVSVLGSAALTCSRAPWPRRAAVVAVLRAGNAFETAATLWALAAACCRDLPADIAAFVNVTGGGLAPTLQYSPSLQHAQEAEQRARGSER